MYYGDTLLSSKTYEASLYSVGGNLTGIDEILNAYDKNDQWKFINTHIEQKKLEN